MFWGIVVFLNVIMAVVELIVAFKSEKAILTWIHIMYSLMFISYSIAAFNHNILFGTPGLIIGLLAVLLNNKNRSK